MNVIHFLNVGEGDCSLIQHASGRNTVIDVSMAKPIDQRNERKFALYESLSGNYRQKDYPENPIAYFNRLGIDEIFRFILTHPDMDHLDGIKALFEAFSVTNFWDTNNNKTIDPNGFLGKYNPEDWEFYQDIRKSENAPKTLRLYAGEHGAYYNKDKSGSVSGDGLYILSPTPELSREANQTGKYNDASYVILFCCSGRKILFAGDSEEKVWDHILENYADDVTDIDILIAPHHGRKTGGNDEYLDVLNPKFTLFGNAKSKDLDYGSWNRRNLLHITNNQAGNVIMEIADTSTIRVYITSKAFAEEISPSSVCFSEKYRAWDIRTL